MLMLSCFSDHDDGEVLLLIMRCDGEMYNDPAEEMRRKAG